MPSPGIEPGPPGSQPDVLPLYYDGSLFEFMKSKSNNDSLSNTRASVLAKKYTRESNCCSNSDEADVTSHASGTSKGHFNRTYDIYAKA